MNKFVILGCGYLGTNISNYILKNYNEQVYVLGIENEYKNYLEKEIRFISKMIEQISDDDRRLFKDAIVIDAVGNINATNNLKNSSAIFLNNCSSKINLIQKLNNFGIKKYVFLSSGGTVYGDSDVPHKESEMPNPKNIYALEKTTEEKYIEIQSSENSSLPYLILRLSNPYGGIISKYKKQGIIDVTINKLLCGEKIELFGKITNVRDYIYVDDVSKAIYKLSISSAENEIFNVGTGVGKSIKDVFQTIEKVYNKKIVYHDMTKNQTLNINTNVLDISKMKKSIGNFKMINLDDGISNIKKYRDNF